ncbi:MAG: hypothetical protein WC723_05070 [Candidatus Omnitrophota bacterium]
MKDEFLESLNYEWNFLGGGNLASAWKVKISEKRRLIFRVELVRSKTVWVLGFWVFNAGVVKSSVYDRLISDLRVIIKDQHTFLRPYKKVNLDICSSVTHKNIKFLL